MGLVQQRPGADLPGGRIESQGFRRRGGVGDRARTGGRRGVDELALESGGDQAVGDVLDGMEPAPAPPAAVVTPAQPVPARPAAAVPVASRDLLAGAARELLAAGSTDDTGLRYARAHLAALRAAAAVLAARARPRGKRSARLRSAWVLLAEVAPELGEWAQFFAAGAAKRAAAEAGLRGVVSEREADDLVRDSEAFLARVARLLGVPHQPLLGGPSAAAS